MTDQPVSDRTVIFEDNKGAQKWSADPTNHAKVKHVDLCYHSIREQVNELKNLAIKYCKTTAMLADPFTKSLPTATFKRMFKTIFGSEKTKID